LIFKKLALVADGWIKTCSLGKRVNFLDSFQRIGQVEKTTSLTLRANFFK